MPFSAVLKASAICPSVVAWFKLTATSAPSIFSTIFLSKTSRRPSAVSALPVMVWAPLIFVLDASLALVARFFTSTRISPAAAAEPVEMMRTPSPLVTDEVIELKKAALAKLLAESAP